MGRALLVIDVQRVYTDPRSPLFVHGYDAAIANMNRLIGGAVPAGELVVYVRHVHRQDGSDAGRMFDYLGSPGELGFVEGTAEVNLDPSLDIAVGAMHIAKQRYSAFVGTGLDEILKGQGVDTIVVTGFMANYCCEATARHGHDLDYFVDFIIDATGCPDLSEGVNQPLIKSVTAAALLGGYGRVLTTEDYLSRQRPTREAGVDGRF
jgi:nicotinamidase-related amidase